MQNLYYDFIIFMAFECAMIYDNKKSLSIKNIKKYKDVIVEKMYDYFYNQHDGFEEDETEKVVEEYFKSFGYVDDEEFIKNFVENNSELFKINDDVISLRKNIDFEEFNALKFKLADYEKPYNKLLCGTQVNFCVCVDALRAAKIDGLLDDSIKMFHIEKENENNFRNIGNPENKVAYDFGNIFIMSNLLNICKKSHFVINYIYRLWLEISNDIGLGLDEIKILSDSVKNEKFYEDNDYILYSKSITYLKALLSENLLYANKMIEYIDYLEELKRPDFDGPVLEPIFPDKFSDYLSSNNNDYLFEDSSINYDEIDGFLDAETEEHDEIEETKINMIFYLMLAKKMWDYDIENNDEMVRQKLNRLLYCLDKNIKIYDYETLEKIINKYDLYDYKKDDFFDFYVLSRLILVDILRYKNNNNILIKLLFVKNYLDITEDKRIERIYNKYQDDDKIANKTYKLLFGNNKGKRKTFEKY